MTRRELRPLAALLVLSAGLHLFRLSEPRRVVFDEVHFGAFISAYCGDGRYFFDIHPPHAKLLIAGVAALGGYRGGQAFEELNQPLTEVSPALLRLAPALAGTLVPLLLFLLMRQLGASIAAALLAGLAVLLDNGLLVQTRVIALDGFLVLGIFGSLCTVLAALRARSRGRRTAFAALAGLLVGLAVGTKFTGLAALGLVGLVLMVDLLRSRSLQRLRVTASVSVWLLSAALSVYAAGWWAHFALLPEPGSGYAFGVPMGSLLRDTVDLHRHMLASNYGLTASHPSASPWWSWPLMLRSVFYWGDGEALIYFLGNPVLWWGATLGLVLASGNQVLLRVTNLRIAGTDRGSPRDLWMLYAGYLISFVPLWGVPRALFLYHYLVPLLFATCAALLWLDHVGWTRTGPWRTQRASVHAVVAALLLGFLAISPLSFGFLEAPDYQQALFEVFPRWR
jgi:dolichyl-phosphate-mannose--protein O-mannosyl transferase